MDKREEREQEPRASQSGKRKYEPPEVVSQEVFETTALACGRRPGQGGRCGNFPKS
jgi:hypothetical protein